MKLANCFGFALLHSVIGLKFSRHFFNQSEPKPIVARACTFSRALCRLRVITSSFNWFTGLSPYNQKPALRCNSFVVS